MRRQGAGSRSTPWQYTIPGIEAYWAFDEDSFLTLVGSRIQAATDQIPAAVKSSGNPPYTVVAPAAPQRPQQVAGRAVFAAGAAENLIESPSLLAPLVAGTVPYTWTARVTPASFNYGHVAATGSSVVGTRGVQPLQIRVPANYANIRFEAGFNFSTGATALVAGVTRTIAGVYDGSGGAVGVFNFLDGIADTGPVAAGALVIGAQDQFALGCFPSVASSQFLSATVAAVLISTQQLSAAQLGRIHGYWSVRYP